MAVVTSCTFFQYGWISVQVHHMWRKVPLSLSHLQHWSETVRNILLSLSGVLYHLVLILYPFSCVFTFREPLCINKCMRSQLVSSIFVSNTDSQVVWSARNKEYGSPNMEAYIAEITWPRGDELEHRDSNR